MYVDKRRRAMMSQAMGRWKERVRRVRYIVRLV